MSATTWLRARVTQLCAGTPWKNRLRYSMCICASSARSIFKALNDLRLYSKPTRLIPINHTVLAMLVLGIYVTKLPSSWMVDSDLAV